MLELCNITAGYGRTTIIENITLHCNDNEAIVIFGPNGAGKTTLLQTIYRFTNIHHGDLYFNGIELSKHSPHDLLPLGMGYIRQRDGVFSSMTVRDNFKMALYSRKHYNLSDVLEETFILFPRLKERIGQTANTLSGGEKKMLAVALVMAQNPDFFLIDELSEGLAPKVRDQVLEVIINVSREKKKALIIVEEATQTLLKLVDRAYCLRDGKIIAEGPNQGFLEKEVIEQLYFGKECESKLVVKDTNRIKD